jgi:hypothetical protein
MARGTKLTVDRKILLKMNSMGFFIIEGGGPN